MSTTRWTGRPRDQVGPERGGHQRAGRALRRSGMGTGEKFIQV